MRTSAPASAAFFLRDLIGSKPVPVHTVRESLRRDCPDLAGRLSELGTDTDRRILVDQVCDALPGLLDVSVAEVAGMARNAQCLATAGGHDEIRLTHVPSMDVFVRGSGPYRIHICVNVVLRRPAAAVSPSSANGRLELGAPNFWEASLELSLGEQRHFGAPFFRGGGWPVVLPDVLVPTLQDGIDHAHVGRIFAAVAPYLRPRLFTSPVELTALFQKIPGLSSRALFLFTRGAGAVNSGEINPRQSFLWDPELSAIREFDRLEQIAELLTSPADRPRIDRRIQSVYDAVSQGLTGFFALESDAAPRNVNILLATRSPTRSERAALKVLELYLELYRNSTIHALNDIYSSRENDLVEVAKNMKASVEGTVESLLAYLRDDPRVDMAAGLALECLGAGRWEVRQGQDHPSAAEVQRCIGSAAAEALAAQGKTFAFTTAGFQALSIPFSKHRAQLTFTPDGLTPDSTPEPFTGQLDRPRFRRRSQNGEWVIVLLFSRPPHANIVHSLVQYRQYYFDTFRPALLQQVRQGIFEEANRLQSRFRTSAAGASVSVNLWDEVARLCGRVMPTLYSALEVSGGISVFSVADDTLETIYSWDNPEVVRVNGHERLKTLSLRKGERGLVATTFLDPSSLSRGIEEIAEGQRVDSPGPAKGPYIALRTTTRSEFCHQLRFKSIRIGVLNFESSRARAFDEVTRQQIHLLVLALEHYIAEFLAAQDSYWLSITAAAYHNLHELRQFAMAWPDERYRDSVLQAISAFDFSLDAGAGSHEEIVEHFRSCVESQIGHVPAFMRGSMKSMLERRCFIRVEDRLASKPAEVDRIRLELMKRVTQNLFGNFAARGLRRGQSSRDILSASLGTRPYPGLYFRQQHDGGFPPEWLTTVGYAPLEGLTPGERRHHGLFLCGAIARSLGGFLWAGNQRTEGTGVRSVLQVIIPMSEE